MTQTWCVATESGARYLVEYDGNGGFGPVTVVDNGWLVRLRYRHTFGSLHDCPTCLDPPHREHLPADRELADPRPDVHLYSRQWRP